MGNNTIETTTLSDVEVRYGIIKISKFNMSFPKLNQNGTEITISCDGVQYSKKIPSHGVYISGLTDLHRKHGAKEGTIVTLKKDGDSFILEYPKKSVNSLQNIIDDIRYLLKEQTWAFFKYEINVRTEIIDPILKQLGWRFPDTLFREPITRDSKKVDYALRYNGQFKILIESKSISSDWGKAKSQLNKYLNDERFDDCIGILTNGVKWEVIQKDKIDPITSITIFDNQFLDFLKCFDFDKFTSIDDPLYNLPKVAKKNTSIIELREIILQEKGNKVVEKNEVTKFCKFIEANIEKVLALNDNGYFRQEVVIKDANFKKARGFERSNKIEGVRIAKDYSTIEKATIIQQIIREIEIQGETTDYSIEIIKDNNDTTE